MTTVMQKVAPAIALCFFLFLSPVWAQQNNPQTESPVFTDLVKREFGLDQNLVNGMQYYNRFSNCMGHPYFLDYRFRKGSITIEGDLYAPVQLRYDLYSQQVELEYENFSGGSNWLVSVVDKVDAFVCGEHQFQKLQLEEGIEKFYQLIPTPCFTLLIFWEKGLVPLSGNTNFTDEFAEAKHSLWLQLDGEVLPINGKKDFLGYFPEEVRKEMKRLLNRNQFKFRTAGVNEISRNMQAICQLLETKETR